jgi:cytochrome b subunit of formate dehydrogenase
MSNQKSKLFWQLLLPIGMLIAMTGVIIWKRGNLESFDWLIIIVLAVMLLIRLIEWVYRRFNSKTTTEASEKVMDAKD